MAAVVKTRECVGDGKLLDDLLVGDILADRSVADLFARAVELGGDG